MCENERVHNNLTENPPLWIWGVIAGSIVAAKFIYRWYALKQYAKETKKGT